jgi:hypothetical protein
MKKILFALAFLLTGLTSEQAPAQQLVKLCYGQPCVDISSGNPLPISGSFSATLTGFTPGGTYATLTATNASASVALPLGTTVAIQNSGTTTVSCTLGVGSATAAASEILVGGGTTVFVTPGSNTFGACIDQTGSTSNLVVLAGGSGLGTGFGGGGGGGGGSVTQGTSPWVDSIGFWNGVALGSPSNYGTSPGAVSVPGVNAFVTNVPAVSQSGTWNVTVNAALPVGTNLLGKVGIDQTTPGTTNGVQVNAALPVGANTIGAVTQASGPWTVTPQATENHIGEVGGNAFSVTNDMTTTSATTTTGQSIGGLQTLANAVRVSGSVGASGTSGYIQTINVSFTDAIGAGPLDVVYFNANPTGSTCTNDSAFILANADRDKVIGIVHVTDFTSLNTAVVAQANNQSMLYTVASATSIYACVVARASFVIAGTTNASLVTRVVRN